MATTAYFGGKSSKVFRDFINTKIPKDGTVKKYMEPFSGSMGTYMDDKELNFDSVIYNDKNRHQVNLVKCCSEPEEFLKNLYRFKEMVLKTELTDPLDKWDFYKALYKKYIKNDFLDNMDFELGDHKKACMYAFLITSSFSAVYPRGAGFSGYNKVKDRLKLEVLINKLEKNKYTDKLKSIDSFNNIDFQELINEHDSDETYIYLDPPYYRYDETKGEDDAKRLFWYGSDDEDVFGPSSHRRLLDLLKGLKSRWSLSYYYFPLLEEILPKDKYLWFEKEVNRSSAHGGKNHVSGKKHDTGTEILILNYDPETGERLFK